jgi:class 3 adenylate cyclase
VDLLEAPTTPGPAKWATIAGVSDDPRLAPGSSPRAGKPGTLRERVRSTDSRPQLVATARWIRRLLPGDERYGDALSTASGGAPDRIGRLVSEAHADRPSAMRELGLGALQAWQALSEAQGRGRGTVDVAILFTDLVGFSPWALEAGDEAALELLRQVAVVEDEAVSTHGGNVVKRLGDGSMSVFRTARDAVGAALQAQAGVGEIEVGGHRPRLRAGVHVGRPRRVGRDYLGVDVNIAARVAQQAKGGEVLASDAVCETLDGDGFGLGRRKRLSAPGAPRGLTVCRVTARAAP